MGNQISNFFFGNHSFWRFYCILDTTNEDQVRDAVETVRSELKQAKKQLFSVICNAAVAEGFPIETTTKQDYDKTFGGIVEVIYTT